MYRYSFHVALPFDIPTSLEALNGHIRYGLQVVLDRPRWSDQKFEQTFTVIKPLNLNHDISLRVNGNVNINFKCIISFIFKKKTEKHTDSLVYTILFFILLFHVQHRLQHPIVEEETKRFNPYCVFVCCASDPLFIIATVPVGGYTPGQMINVDLELTNTSNENISAFVIQIIRVSFKRSTVMVVTNSVRLIGMRTCCFGLYQVQ